MTFGQPLWFYALLLLPLAIVLYVLAEKRSAQKLTQLVAPKLAPQLTQTVNRGKRAVRFSLTLLGLAAVIGALARPQLGYEYQEVKRKGRDIVVAIDTSKSMLADDVSPNRLSRAKLAMQDLLRILDGDRVALVAFAGTAFLQAPLTIDYGAVEDSLAELDTNIIPKGGTNLAAAIDVSLEAFGKAEGSNKALVLFTDGEELDADALKAAAKAKEAGVKIFTVGVGSTAGALIPIQENGTSTFVRDQAGQFVKTRLDESRLREIASATGGFYVHLENGSNAVQILIDRGIRHLEEKEGDEKMSRRPIERYQWPLGLALVSLMLAGTLSDRRRSATALAAALFCLAPRAQAVQFPQFDQDKRDFNAGVNAYRGEKMDDALEAFARASTSQNPEVKKKAEYNAANTLFQRGSKTEDHGKKIADWKNSLAHYDEALKIDPQYADAKYNRDIVEKLLKEDEQKKQEQEKRDEKEKQDQQQQQQQQQQNQQSQDQKNQDQKGQDPKNQQQQNSGKSDQKPQNSGKQEDQPPTSGQNQQNDQKQAQNGEPTPAPMPTPGEKKEGELKTADAGDPKDEKGRQAEQEATESEKEGEMSKAQARALLQSMEGEEQRVILRDMPNQTEVSKDW